MKNADEACLCKSHWNEPLCLNVACCQPVVKRHTELFYRERFEIVFNDSEKNSTKHFTELPGQSMRPNVYMMKLASGCGSAIWATNYDLVWHLICKKCPLSPSWFGSVRFSFSLRAKVCYDARVYAWQQICVHELNEAVILCKKYALLKVIRGVSLFLVALNSQLHPGWLETSALSLHMDTHVGAPVELNGTGCIFVICYLTQCKIVCESTSV